MRQILKKINMVQHAIQTGSRGERVGEVRIESLIISTIAGSERVETSINFEPPLLIKHAHIRADRIRAGLIDLSRASNGEDVTQKPDSRRDLEREFHYSQRPVVVGNSTDEAIHTAIETLTIIRGRPSRYGL